MSAIASQIRSRRPAYVAPAGQPIMTARPVGGTTTAPTLSGNARLLAVNDANLGQVVANLGPMPRHAGPTYNGQTLPPPVTVPPLTIPPVQPGPFDNLSWTDAAIGIGVVIAASVAIIYVVRSRQAPAAPPTTRRTSTSQRR